MASVLFLDMVQFSTMPMEQQRAYLSELQNLVSDAPQVKSAGQEQSIVKLPTGDGMALVFFGDPTRGAEGAVEIAAAIKKRPHLRVRMGLHIGPVYRVADINRNLNVSGGGINMCQRVMDGGDAGHILISGTMHEVLKELGRWRPYLKDLGEHEIKHGLRLHFYNLCTEDVGNPEPPLKWRSSKPERRPRKWTPLVLATLVVLGLAIGAAVAFMTPKHPAAPKLELSYQILVQRFKENKPDGPQLVYATPMIFQENLRVAGLVTPAQAGFLYVVNEGPAEDGSVGINILHPSPGASAQVSANQTVRIPELPPPGDWIRFDKAAGTELVYLVFSAKPVPDFEAAKDDRSAMLRNMIVIRDAARRASLDKVLSAHSLPASQVHKDEEAKRTTLVSDQDIMVYTIRLEHQ